MKIDNTTFKPTTGSVTQRAPAKASSDSVASSAEAVSLSPLAGALQGNETPPVSSARIQEIKDAIAQGRFQINADAIAGRLIETARDMVSQQRRA